MSDRREVDAAWESAIHNQKRAELADKVRAVLERCAYLLEDLPVKLQVAEGLRALLGEISHE